jgi:SAM-dependent methyltransferase
MGKRNRHGRPPVRDKHLLYTAAVQCVDADLDFLQRVYSRKHGQRFVRLKEDFCGTAAMACEFVRRSARHEAWGVDLDSRTLDWSRRRYVPRLGAGAGRLHLICDDVRAVTRPKVHVIAAQNFSYAVFKTRDELRRYFRQARRSLAPGGMFFLDVLGGSETTGELKERRRIAASRAWDGTRIPPFTYVWEQQRFNPIDHRLLCRIHFKLSDGTALKRAFTYDWRLWTLPELRELMIEAGFGATEVYAEGWDDEADEADGVFRLRTSFENQEGWVAYVVGLT